MILSAYMQAKKKNWEKHLMDETIGNDTNELIKKGLEWEKEYIKSLPNPGESKLAMTFKLPATGSFILAGETPQYVANRSPLDHLLKAARCYATALQTSPKNMELNLALGLVMEEFFYVDDLFGMQREEDEVEKEGEAEMSSKQEEFLAICKLHGVAPSASISIQLKAVESEYHNLKDAGQTHKAEHVQALHAWKSKKVLQVSGSYQIRSCPVLSISSRWGIRSCPVVQDGGLGLVQYCLLVQDGELGLVQYCPLVQDGELGLSISSRWGIRSCPVLSISSRWVHVWSMSPSKKIV